MNYNFSEDLKSIRGILNLTQSELAEQLDIPLVTITRSEDNTTEPTEKLMDIVYGFAFSKGIKLNRLKEMFWLESCQSGHKLLFHGAKSEIKGPVRIDAGRANNDFGNGFYTGESYAQAVSFVSAYNNPSVYLIDFDKSGLSCAKYEVNQEWMLTIAYYRGALKKYSENAAVQSVIAKSRECDYIIAPIADNRMFSIINSFIDGEITDEQCKHCLAATNLGNQYVFVSEKSLDHIKLVERCFVPNIEKKYYKSMRSEDAALGDNKVKLARIQYRGQGKYVDEIFV